MKITLESTMEIEETRDRLDNKSFASDMGSCSTHSIQGRLLSICGQEYKAWKYDTYIYDALDIAACWTPEERTYDRITHLRYWLRENIQHGHSLPINVRSLKEAKQLIDRIIEAEYQFVFDWNDVDEGIKMRNEALQDNAKIMGAINQSLPL